MKTWGFRYVKRNKNEVETVELMQVRYDENGKIKEWEPVNTAIFMQHEKRDLDRVVTEIHEAKFKPNLIFDKNQNIVDEEIGSPSRSFAIQFHHIKQKELVKQINKHFGITLKSEGFLSERYDNPDVCSEWGVRLNALYMNVSATLIPDIHEWEKQMDSFVSEVHSHIQYIGCSKEQKYHLEFLKEYLTEKDFVMIP